MARQRAIVIGGSMSGMLAARVLADHFAEVVLFDRDAFPKPGENRKGVPQGQHAHALLSSGREVLERYFPGFKDELFGQGALKGDYRKLRWFDNGVYHIGFDGLEALLVSRPCLEAHVRSRLAALPNVRVAERTDVESLAVDNGEVIGVNVRSATGARSASGGSRGRCQWPRLAVAGLARADGIPEAARRCCSCRARLHHADVST